MFDATWNAKIIYGTRNDSRDQQTYRTVEIGGTTWMAENLNCRDTSGSSDTVGACHGGSTDSCSKHGRLYTWFWSASEYVDVAADAWRRIVYSGGAAVYRDDYDKGGGFSLRCRQN